MSILIEDFHIELNNFLAILYIETINELLKVKQCLLKKLLLNCSAKVIYWLLRISFIRNKIY